MKKDNEEDINELEEEFLIDGGTDGKWGWFVVFNSFICNLIVDGMQYTFSNFLIPISLAFNVSTPQVSLIGSLLSGFYNFSAESVLLSTSPIRQIGPTKVSMKNLQFFIEAYCIFVNFLLFQIVFFSFESVKIIQIWPIASALGNKFGFRMVIITGSLISSGALMLCYFATDILYLCFFYGILAGLGFGMIYMASVIMTSLYFEKYRALASSVSVCGTGVGTFVFAPLGAYLVETLGWRYALLIEGGILLLCILCGLSFKPLNVIKVVPVSRRLSVTSDISELTSAYRGSVFYANETKKTLRNEKYPTLKEALQQQGDIDRRGTVGSIMLKSRYQSFQGSLGNFHGQAPKFSYLPSIITVRDSPSRNCRERCKKQCDVCCFNFWHCQCKQKDLTLGDRPMYRDDIFYGGSLTTLNKYSSAERINYHLSVMRIPGVAELQEHESRKCCVCHQAVLRTCITMTGFNLLSSKVFLLLCISCFMYTLSLYIPYVFIRKVANNHEVPEEISLWLVSAIGVFNTLGRLASGIIKSFIKINAAIFAFACLTISGVFSFVFIIRVDIITLFVFCCAFGLFTAPFTSLRPVIIVDFLGLEKLTNAFGLMLLVQGIASISGPPIAGLVEEKTGQSLYAIYLSGCFLIVSSIALLASTLLNRKIKKIQTA